MKERGILNFNLYNWLVNSLFDVFDSRLNLSFIEKEKLKYGLNVVVINVCKVLMVIILSSIVGVFKESIIIMSSFFVLRISGAGLHAKSSIACTISSLIIYIGGALLCNIFDINKYILIGIYIICIILLSVYSPADTANKPILGCKKRRKLNIQTVISALILMFVSIIFLNKKTMTLIMFGMLVETISILPITYKFLKRSYNNYEKYEKKIN